MRAMALFFQSNVAREKEKAGIHLASPFEEGWRTDLIKAWKIETSRGPRRFVQGILAYRCPEEMACRRGRDKRSVHTRSHRVAKGPPPRVLLK